MKAIALTIFVISIFSSFPVYPCPNFSGIYFGSCKINFNGTESIQNMPIGITQPDCDHFNFNDLTTNYYTLGNSSIYIDVQGKSKYLKRAEISDDGSSLYLHQTIEEKASVAGDALIVSTYVFKKIDDKTISYAGETFDFLAGKASVITSCSDLKKH